MVGSFSQNHRSVTLLGADASVHKARCTLTIHDRRSVLRERPRCPLVSPDRVSGGKAAIEQLNRVETYPLCMSRSHEGASACSIDGRYQVVGVAHEDEHLFDAS